WSHGAAPAQECRLRLKRLPPKALPWFPPFKSSTPERFRGSCPFACSPAVANGKLVLPFWKEKLRSGLIFPSNTESKRFLQGGGEDQGEHGRIPFVRDNGRLIKKQH